MKCSVIKFVRDLGLTFGCLDFIVTPDDRLVFLEINPNGQWLWIQRLTGMPIGESVARLLAGGSSPQNSTVTADRCTLD
jgi:glutathione synthase/RimK-type ligase-like ATP-grasp enzyme